jgi:hypothetical protein
LAKDDLFEGLKQLVTQKFQEWILYSRTNLSSSEGVMRANTIGYRYIVHIGFAFKATG